ncbi:hypothetical protein A3Q56_06102 [Intoshia linei]|uniref:Phenylalanine--tRNA ligase beta subunit n=1 Tax=Intoshia linei TaxID=1819745 RepID=A0A177AVZ2_9BILA|nr:hypothetical protein A3Q56_06102 [Intoshia linei]
MPTISVRYKDLMNLLGEKLDDEQVDQLLFDYGLELDQITCENETISNISNIKDEEKIYKIETPANRFDLLSVEGLAAALSYFMGKPTDRHIVLKKEKMSVIQVDSSVESIRPFVVGAIMRNVVFNPENYKSFIDLQDKLHSSIGRNRSIVSMGTHDLDTIQGPFVYKALPPSQIIFKPLNASQKYSADELIELYSKNSHLKPYLNIIKNFDKYPVILDANGVVCSMPPIINGEHSKLSIETKNIFIEITATDEHRANVALNSLVTAFSCYLEKKFQVDAISIEYDERTEISPNLSYRQEKLHVNLVNSRIGINETQPSMIRHLNRMGFNVKPFDENTLLVSVPPNRSDILHWYDLCEDVAISYGYNNIIKKMPSTNAITTVIYMNDISDKLRAEIAYYGYNEALTFSLYSKSDVFYKRDDLPSSVTSKECLDCVCILNPKTTECQMVRKSLIPGLLKTLSANQIYILPLKLFEVSDVVLMDLSNSNKASNQRNIAAVYMSTESSFQVIHGLLDKILNFLGLYNKTDYVLEKDETNIAYFSPRCAKIKLLKSNAIIGSIGIIHPKTIKNYEIPYIVSAFEFNLQMLLKYL